MVKKKEANTLKGTSTIKGTRKKTVKKKIKKEKPKKVSTNFVYILSIVSITGFLGIIIDSFFGVNIDNYITFLWLLIMGIGFILIARPKQLYDKSKSKFDESNLSELTTFVVGIIAIIAGILSMPEINIQHPVFLAVKGVISIISVIFIIVQTWIINN